MRHNHSRQMAPWLTSTSWFFNTVQFSLLFLLSKKKNSCVAVYWHTFFYRKCIGMRESSISTKKKKRNRLFRIMMPHRRLGSHQARCLVMDLWVYLLGLDPVAHEPSIRWMSNRALDLGSNHYYQSWLESSNPFFYSDKKEISATIISARKKRVIPIRIC